MRITQLKSVISCSKDRAYVQRVANSGRTCVNVWGAVSKHGLGPLQRIAGRLTSATANYCNIMDAVLLPFVHSGLFPDHNFLFPQDLAPVHTARVAKNHLQQCGIEELAWVPKGADMNIIENVWGRTKVAMVRTPIYSATEDQLLAAVLAEWESLKADTIFVSSLYESLPSRMAAVIQLNGEMTRY